MRTLLVSFFVCLLLSCSDRPHDGTTTDTLPPIYPDYVGVTIPADLAPLNFGIKDSDVETLDVVVKGKGGEIHANGDYADFDMDEWHALTQKCRGDSLMVTVCAKRDGAWTQYKEFPIYVSGDELGEWGLTYRLIPPGYETYGNMGLYQRDLHNFDQTAIIENRDIDMNCVNCHTSNRTDPKRFTFHVRGDHGASVVGHGDNLDILVPRNEALGGGMVYPYWHPSGNLIAYSTNQTHQLFHQLHDKRVEVYDNTSDIIIYDVVNRQIRRDSRVATADYLENYPAFSPDGRWLYFCKAEKIDSIWSDYKDIRYNICRVALDSATAELNGEVETVIDARAMGKSANQPRISYDGRFLLYTLSDYGCFPIWHKEADLWMKDLVSDEAFPLDAANSPDAESFHNWSLNSRWIVFTSRRNDGLYTQLLIAHVSPEGIVSKPFLLPQRNPLEYDAETTFSFNTPDFASAPLRYSPEEISRKIMNEERTGTVLIDN